MWNYLSRSVLEMLFAFYWNSKQPVKQLGNLTCLLVLFCVIKVWYCTLLTGIFLGFRWFFWQIKWRVHVADGSMFYGMFYEDVNRFWISCQTCKLYPKKQFVFFFDLFIHFHDWEMILICVKHTDTWDVAVKESIICVCVCVYGFHRLLQRHLWLNVPNWSRG